MKSKSILKKAAAAIIVVLIIAAAVLWSLFGNLIRTLNSIERIGDTQLFTMDFKGDYGFDEFLETGASTDTELINFIVGQLLHGIPLEFDLPDLGCSTFASKTPDGDVVFGRNFDMYYSPALLVRTEPDNGYRSMSMVNLAYIGYGEDKLPLDMMSSFLSLAAPYTPLDGVNEKGLAVGVLLIDTEPTNQQTDKVDITTTTAIRMMLDKCATVDEAVEMLKNYDMHSSANSCYHFQIADSSGKSVVVEYIGDEMNVIETEAATNFLLTPGDYPFGKGQDRYDTIVRMLAENKYSVSEEEAMEILEAAKQEPSPEKDSSTQWSCVYNLTDLTLDVAVGRDYENIYEFSLNEQ